MADHRLDKFLDMLDEGHKAGESLNEVRNRFKGLGAELAIVVTNMVVLNADKLGNSEACIKTWAAPFPLEITKITGIKTTSADTAVAVMTAAGNNPLTGANVNMHALTADTPASQTLSATAAHKLMSTGDLFKCTFTCGASGTLDGGSITIEFKPIQPFE